MQLATSLAEGLLSGKTEVMYVVEKQKPHMHSIITELMIMHAHYIAN